MLGWQSDTPHPIVGIHHLHVLRLSPTLADGSFPAGLTPLIHGHRCYSACLFPSITGGRRWGAKPASRPLSSRPGALHMADESETNVSINTPSRRNAIKALATSMAVPIATQAAERPYPPALSTDDIVVTQYGAKGDGVADDTKAFEQAIRLASEQGRRVRIPAGRYKITRTLIIRRGIRIEGDGVERSVILGSAGAGSPIFHAQAKPTDSIIGLMIFGLSLVGTVQDHPCDGIRLSTSGSGSAIHQTEIRNLFIRNIGTGVSIAGVVYRSIFENITVSGQVFKYGFYSEAGFEDVTYNSFRDLEVTNVMSGGYAYWLHSNFSNFTNLTADGCCYFSSPGGSIRNLAIEQITAEKPPARTAIQLNQVQIADGINLIGVDGRKCQDGIHVIGQGVSIRGVRFVAPQPERAIVLDHGSEGELVGVYIEKFSRGIDQYTAPDTLRRWTISAARSLVPVK